MRNARDRELARTSAQFQEATSRHSPNALPQQPHKTAKPPLNSSAYRTLTLFVARSQTLRNKLSFAASFYRTLALFVARSKPRPKSMVIASSTYQQRAPSQSVDIPHTSYRLRHSSLSTFESGQSEPYNANTTIHPSNS